MEQHEHRRRDIEGYVLSQLRVGPAEIEHIELIQQQWIDSECYEIWDCHTATEGRWWVVTPMTNLYPQDEFKSADYTLTFHIGLTRRVLSRAGPLPEDQERLDILERVFHQLDRAMDAANQVIEVKDAQAAGVALRETLIALATGLVDLVPELSGVEDPPKKGDFIGWAGRAADVLAQGKRKRQHRSYLKATAKHAWQYVNWLTHDRQGYQQEAMAGAHMVGSVVEDFAWAAMMYRLGRPIECPACGSRRVSADSTYLDTRTEIFDVCEVCGWRSEVRMTPRPDGLQRSAESEVPTGGPCTMADEGPGR